MDNKVSTIKDYLIRRIVVDTGLPERVIRCVIDDSFTKAIKATATNKSIEIPGWGVFYFSESRAKKAKEKYISQITLFTKLANDPALSELKRKNAEAKLKAAENNLKCLLPRIDE